MAVSLLVLVAVMVLVVVWKAVVVWVLRPCGSWVLLVSTRLVAIAAQNVCLSPAMAPSFFFGQVPSSPVTHTVRHQHTKKNRESSK